VHYVGVLRIHPHAAHVTAAYDARVVVGHLSPSGAAIVGAEQSLVALEGHALRVGVHRHRDRRPPREPRQAVALRPRAT
jgi:hypothetical protein